MKKPPAIYRTIPADLIRQERRAAIKHRKSLDGIATGIYRHFFRRMAEVERVQVFADVPTKKMGRKVK